MTIKDVIVEGKRLKEIAFTVKPAFVRHLEYLAKIEGNKLGHVLDIEQYIFSVLAEKVRNNPAPMQTKEEVAQIAGCLGTILDHSMDELCDKFKHYGNSYLEIAPSYAEGIEFWRKRLENETQEYSRALTPQERKRKLANLLNLVWMGYAWELQKEGVKL